MNFFKSISALALLFAFLFNVNQIKAHGDCDAGNFNGGFTISGTFAPDVLRGVKYTVSAPGTLNNLALNGLGTNAQVKMALYMDNAGVPGALFAETNVGIVGTGDILLPVITPLHINPGDYWLVAIYDNSGTSTAHTNSTTTTTSNVYEMPLAFGSAFPVNGSGFTNCCVLDFEYWMEIQCCVQQRVENVNACEFYDHPDGNTYTSTGSSPYTIPAANGCDTIVYVNYYIYYHTTSSIVVTSCDEYVSPNGVLHTLTSVFNDTIPNSNGCDSVITIDLTITQSTISSVAITVCDSYESPSGITYTSTGIYTDTISNSISCDSVITIDLTILNSTTSTILDSLNSGTYTGPSGAVYNTDGVYNDTVPNAAGCDSIITLYISQPGATFSYITEASCYSYLSPAGNTYIYSGNYVDTIPNSATGDSLISIDLTINNTTYDTINPVACGQFVSPAGNTYTSSGTYTETIQSAAGCDSVITVVLNLLSGYYITLNVSNCGDYLSPAGNIYTTSGVYNDTLTSLYGCDSIIETNLQISQSADFTLILSNCGPYTSDAGNLYPVSGNYIENLTTSEGCDSTLTIKLSILALDITVTNSGGTLTSGEIGGAYQWLDCDNGFSSIPGANGQSFTPTQIGNYALFVSNTDCSDTTNCIPFIGVGLETIEIEYSVYPNPFRNQFFVESSVESESHIEIVSLDGKVILNTTFNGDKLEVQTGDWKSGMYIVKIENQGLIRFFKLFNGQ
ncbi:MAG: hypothetical protein ACI9N1_000818 [Flavobacteriales bacterium]|jgi:hypothetical protein